MILNKIITEKKKQIKLAQQKVPLAELIKSSAGHINGHRNFQQAISRSGKINLIAEIKKASPSKGILREHFNPVEIAATYESCQAAALSILTEKAFFQGDISFLTAVRRAVKLPLLRKDFIIDQYQIYESVCAGADAILLIARILSEQELSQFIRLSSQLNLDVVCEVHNEDDLTKALGQELKIIGINNRNLETFSEDLQTTTRLIANIPKDKIVISESAIKKFTEVQHLKGLGVDAVLIGEVFMRSQDIKAKVQEVIDGKN